MKIQLNQYQTIVKYPVHWGDMDAANHVNNLIYLRWAESARIFYFDAISMDISFSTKSIGPILGWQDCKYIFPISFPDTAIVGVKTIEIKEDRLIMEAAVFSERHQRIAAISKQSIIPYNYAELKKAAMPEAWSKGIKEHEKM